MKKGSKIIQVASGSAFLPQKDFTVYAASKAYVVFRGVFPPLPPLLLLLWSIPEPVSQVVLFFLAAEEAETHHEKRIKVRTISIDITDEKKLSRFAEVLMIRNAGISVLVNGFPLFFSFMYIADCFSFRFFGGPMMPAFFSVVLQVVRSRPSGAGFLPPYPQSCIIRVSTRETEKQSMSVKIRMILLASSQISSVLDRLPASCFANSFPIPEEAPVIIAIFIHTPLSCQFIARPV